MKHGTLDLQICSPRLSGAKGAFLRVVTHPLSAAFLGFLVMIPDGVWAALLGTLLAVVVALWGWSAHAWADRMGKALIGAANRQNKLQEEGWATLGWLRCLVASEGGQQESIDDLPLIHRVRLGAPHVCLSPRLTPTPILTRASG